MSQKKCDTFLNNNNNNNNFIWTLNHHYKSEESYEILVEQIQIIQYNANRALECLVWALRNLQLVLAYSWRAFCEGCLSLSLGCVWGESGSIDVESQNWRRSLNLQKHQCLSFLIMATVCWQLPHPQQHLSSEWKEKMRDKCDTHLIIIYFLAGVVAHSATLFVLTCYWSKSLLCFLFYLFNSNSLCFYEAFSLDSVNSV